MIVLGEGRIQQSSNPSAYCQIYLLYSTRILVGAGGNSRGILGGGVRWQARVFEHTYQC